MYRAQYASVLIIQVDIMPFKLTKLTLLSSGRLTPQGATLADLSKPD